MDVREANVSEREPATSRPLRFPAFAEATAMQALEDLIRDHPDLDRPAQPAAVRPLLDAVDALVAAAYDAPAAPLDLAGPDNQLGHEYIHPIKTAELCIVLAQAGDVSRAEARPLAAAAALMDIGYAALRRSLLEEPRGLEDHEWRAQVARHPEYGVRILSAAGLADGALAAIAEHHERWDGGGALGRRGTEINGFARIIAIADTYASLRSRLADRNALSHSEAVALIERDAGAAFDPDLVGAFVDALAPLAPGSARVTASASNVAAALSENDRAASGGRQEQPRDDQRYTPVVREDAPSPDDLASHAHTQRAAARISVASRPVTPAVTLGTPSVRRTATTRPTRVSRPAPGRVAVRGALPRGGGVAPSLWSARFYLRTRL